MGTGPWERLTRAAILILLFAGRGDLFSSRTRASLRATLTSVAHVNATWDARRIASILYDFPDEYTHMVMGGGLSFATWARGAHAFAPHPVDDGEPDTRNISDAVASGGPYRGMVINDARRRGGRTPAATHHLAYSISIDGLREPSEVMGMDWPASEVAYIGQHAPMQFYRVGEPPATAVLPISDAVGVSMFRPATGGRRGAPYAATFGQMHHPFESDPAPRLKGLEPPTLAAEGLLTNAARPSDGHGRWHLADLRLDHPRQGSCNDLTTDSEDAGLGHPAAAAIGGQRFDDNQARAGRRDLATTTGGYVPPGDWPVHVERPRGHDEEGSRRTLEGCRRVKGEGALRMAHRNGSAGDPTTGPLGGKRGAGAHAWHDGRLGNGLARMVTYRLDDTDFDWPADDAANNGQHAPMQLYRVSEPPCKAVLPTSDAVVVLLIRSASDGRNGAPFAAAFGQMHQPPESAFAPRLGDLEPPTLAAKVLLTNATRLIVGQELWRADVSVLNLRSNESCGHVGTDAAADDPLIIAAATNGFHQDGITELRIRQCFRYTVYAPIRPNMLEHDMDDQLKETCKGPYGGLIGAFVLLTITACATIWEVAYAVTLAKFGSSRAATITDMAKTDDAPKDYETKLEQKQLSGQGERPVKPAYPCRHVAGRRRRWPRRLMAQRRALRGRRTRSRRAAPARRTRARRSSLGDKSRRHAEPETEDEQAHDRRRPVTEPYRGRRRPVRSPNFITAVVTAVAIFLSLPSPVNTDVHGLRTPCKADTAFGVGRIGKLCDFDAGGSDMRVNSSDPKRRWWSQYPRMGEADNPGPGRHGERSGPVQLPDVARRRLISSCDSSVLYSKPGHGSLRSVVSPGHAGAAAQPFDHEDFRLLIESVNSTGWAALKRRLMTTKAHVVLAQETWVTQSSVAAASAWARKRGWRSVWSPAKVTNKGGVAAGVAIFARDFMGLHYPAGGSHEIHPARAVTGTLQAPGNRPIDLVSCYLQHGRGAAEANAQTLAEVGAACKDDPDGVRIVGGDFNMSPDELLGTGFDRELGATILHTDTARGTFRTARTRSTIDYFLISDRLAAAVDSIMTVEGSGVRGHTPVQLAFKPRLASLKALHVRQPPRLELDRVYGPLLCPPPSDMPAAVAQAALAAARAGTETFDDVLELAYGAWADLAEAEIEIYTGTYCKKRGERAKRPKLVWRSVLPERKLQPRFSRPAAITWLRSIAAELQRIVGVAAAALHTAGGSNSDGQHGPQCNEAVDDECDIADPFDADRDDDMDVVNPDGAHPSDDDHMTYCTRERRGRRPPETWRRSCQVTDEIYASLFNDFPEGDPDATTMEAWEKVRDLVCSIGEAAAPQRYPLAQEDDGRWRPRGDARWDETVAIAVAGHATRAEALREDLDALDAAATADQNSEDAKRWREWLTHDFKAGASRAHAFSRIPQEVVPSAVATEGGAMSSTPGALMETQREKYRKLWRPAHGPLPL